MILMNLTKLKARAEGCKEKMKDKARKDLQQTNEFVSRPKLRLSEIERLIKKKRIIVPPPSRPTLITMCEEGVFETAGNGATQFGWLVFEDSFLEWLRKLEHGDA